jgi:hypothetical protein
MKNVKLPPLSPITGAKGTFAVDEVQQDASEARVRVTNPEVDLSETPTERATGTWGSVTETVKMLAEGIKNPKQAIPEAVEFIKSAVERGYKYQELQYERIAKRKIAAGILREKGVYDNLVNAYENLAKHYPKAYNSSSLIMGYDDVSATGITFGDFQDLYLSLQDQNLKIGDQKFSEIVNERYQKLVETTEVPAQHTLEGFHQYDGAMESTLERIGETAASIKTAAVDGDLKALMDIGVSALFAHTGMRYAKYAFDELKRQHIDMKYEDSQGGTLKDVKESGMWQRIKNKTTGKKAEDVDAS